MRGAFSKPYIIICVPSGVTQVEKRAVEEVAYQTGAKGTYLIEEPLAAAIGAGLPVSEATGSMVINIGGGTTEVAVLSLSGIVASCSVCIAGDKFDDAIIAYVKKKCNMLIGEKTAEDIKISIGSAHEYPNEGDHEVKGSNLLDGLPSNIKITAKEVRDALGDSLTQVVDAIRSTLERTPPELAADIIDRGIMLTGGGALLRGLDELIARETGLPVNVAEQPLDCVVHGTGKLLEDNNASYSALLLNAKRG